MSKYRPTFNRVEVEVIEENVSGILFDSKTHAVAIIKALGQSAGYREGVKLQDFSVGQKVIVDRPAINTIATVNEQLSIVTDDRIAAIIE